MRTLLSLLPPRNEVWDKVMLLHLSFCSPGGGVCLWIQGGCLPLVLEGGSASGSRSLLSASGCRGLHPRGHSLWTHTCPLDTPPDTHTLGHTQTHPGHTPTPLWTRTHTLDTPPPDIGHWSGRYASYWNAFLLLVFFTFLIRIFFLVGHWKFPECQQC